MDERKNGIIYLVGTLILAIMVQVRWANAQMSRELQCGGSVESVFTQNYQIHSYSFEIASDTAVIAYVETSESSYEELLLDLELTDSRGNVVISRDFGQVDFWVARQTGTIRSSDTIETELLPKSGIYTVNVIGFTDTGGTYNLYVACVSANGTVASSTPKISSLECGSIVENQFMDNLERNRYYLLLESGTSLQLYLASEASSYENLLFDLLVKMPRGNVVIERQLGDVDYWIADQTGSVDSTLSVSTDPLNQSGVYHLEVIGYTDTGGQYTLQVGCTLSDGRIINPGDTFEQDFANDSASVESFTECPNGTVPRLTVGLQGRVIPGDANNVRSEPSSTTVIGQIPGGEQFTVLEGPVCGLNGLTFWRVQYGELNGWTAEGQGTEYWLEPVQSGRG